MQLFEELSRIEDTDDESLHSYHEDVIEYISQIVSRTTIIHTPRDFDPKRDIDDHDSLVESLLDLTKYDSNALLFKSFATLHRIVNTNSEILRLAEESTLLLDRSSIALANYLRLRLTDLRELGADVIDSTDMKYVSLPILMAIVLMSIQTEYSM